MPEQLRRIAGHIREFLGNRRRSPRYKVTLPVLVSLLDAGAVTEAAAVQGQTRDVSESGLAVILPNIRVGGRYLVGDSVTLRLTLKLPDGYARLYGTPVRYEKLEGPDAPKGFLVGIRLTDRDERDHSLLVNYINSLGKR